MQNKPTQVQSLGVILGIEFQAFLLLSGTGYMRLTGWNFQKCLRDLLAEVPTDCQWSLYSWNSFGSYKIPAYCQCSIITQPCVQLEYFSSKGQFHLWLYSGILKCEFGKCAPKPDEVLRKTYISCMGCFFLTLPRGVAYQHSIKHIFIPMTEKLVLQLGQFISQFCNKFPEWFQAVHFSPKIHNPKLCCIMLHFVTYHDMRGLNSI